MRRVLKVLSIFVMFLMFTTKLTYGKEIEMEGSVYTNFSSRVKYGYVRRVLILHSVTEENKKKLTSALDEENKLYEEILEIRDNKNKERIKENESLNRLYDSIMQDVYNGRLSKDEADRKIKENRSIELQKKALEVKKEKLLLLQNKREIYRLNRKKKYYFKLIEKNKDQKYVNQYVLELVEIINEKNKFLKEKIEILE